MRALANVWFEEFDRQAYDAGRVGAWKSVEHVAADEFQRDARGRLRVEMRVVGFRVVGLVAVSVLSAGLVGCASTGPYSRDEVAIAFSDAVHDRTLPDRQEYLRWWATDVMVAKVSYVEDKDVYEIRTGGGAPDGYELWRFDMKTRAMTPENGAALLSAILFFCSGRQDATHPCPVYFRLLDQLVGTEGKGESLPLPASPRKGRDERAALALRAIPTGLEGYRDGLLLVAAPDNWGLDAPRGDAPGPGTLMVILSF